MMYKKIGYFETFNYFLIRYHSSSPSIQNSQFCIDVSSSIKIFMVFSNVIIHSFFQCTFYSPVFQKGCPKRVALAPRNLLKACGANGFGISFCFPLASFGQDPDTFPIPRQFTMENTIFAIFAYLFISLWLPRSLHDSLLLLLANQKIGRKPRS